MNEESIAEGIRQFATNTRATVSKESDLAFQITFPGEGYFSILGIEGFGAALSYTTPCGVLSGVSLAPQLLKRNWGSVVGTGFYFSVHLEGKEPCLYLETLQLLGPNATAGHVASILAMCCLQCRQARESLNSTAS